MIKKLHTLALCAYAILAMSCSDSDNEIQNPVEEPGTTPDVEIDYSKVGVEYDDGKNIVFNVKIGIDKEGWEMRDREFFVTRLKRLWDEINVRFNNGALERRYIFVPDLEDIIVYESLGTKAICGRDGETNWDALAHAVEDGRFDTDKYQIFVNLDFVPQVTDKGEGGGGCGWHKGISNILVINAGEKWDNKFYDHFDKKIAPNTAAAITHELGHARGLIDIYNHPVTAANNPHWNQPFAPIEGIMHAKTYGSIADCTWSDYEIDVINLNAEKQGKPNPHYCYTCMNDWFADELEVYITEDGKPVTESTVNFYNSKYDGGRKIDRNIYRTYAADHVLTLDAHDLFWWGDWKKDDDAWKYHELMLVEVINKETGHKGYSYLANYEIHWQGIKDKRANRDAHSVYKLVIDIKGE